MDGKNDAVAVMCPKIRIGFNMARMPASLSSLYIYKNKGDV